MCAVPRSFPFRAIEGTGDEFEIVVATNPDGSDVMTVRLEHEAHETPDEIARRVAAEVRTRCEIRSKSTCSHAAPFPRPNLRPSAFVMNERSSATCRR